MRPLIVICVVFVACQPDRELIDMAATTRAIPTEIALENGGTATLTTATATFGDLVFEQPARTTALSWLSPIQTATAHPGHDFAGGVGGELLGEWTVDWLADDLSLGTAQLYEGEYATARLFLPPETHITLAGDAVIDGKTVAFDLDLVADQPITGISFVHIVDPLDPPAALVVSFDPAHALAFIDWDTPDDDGDGLLTETDGDIANTSRFGLTATPSWHLSLEDQP